MGKQDNLPRIKTEPSKYDINSIPDYGKGFIYAVDWGFRLGRGSNYGSGVYFGLTIQTAMERYKQHEREAKKLGFKSASKQSIKGSYKVSSVRPNGEEAKTGRLFYIALATSIGTGINYKSGDLEAYRSLRIIKEVNLLDLAYEEKKLIKEHHGPSTENYNSYEELFYHARESRNPIVLNSSAGGEGSKFSKKGTSTVKEVVAASYFFLTESTRRNVVHGIQENKNYEDIKVLSKDISKVTIHFKNTNEPYEKLAMSGARVNPEIIQQLLEELGILKRNGKITSDILGEAELFMELSRGSKHSVIKSSPRRLQKAFIEHKPDKVRYYITKKSEKGGVLVVDKDTIEDFEKVAKESFFRYTLINFFKYYEKETGEKVPKNFKNKTYDELEKEINKIKKEFPLILEKYQKRNQGTSAKEKKNKKK